MLQSIKRALRVDPENGELHLNIVNFVMKGRCCVFMLIYQFMPTVTVQSSRDELPDPVLIVIDESLPSLTSSSSLTELNRDFLQKHKHSHKHIICG